MWCIDNLLSSCKKYIYLYAAPMKIFGKIFACRTDDGKIFVKKKTQLCTDYQSVSLVPRSRPAFHHFQYRTESWVGPGNEATKSLSALDAASS